MSGRVSELTVHVSLLDFYPAAFVLLRTVGQCEFSIPEVLFDLDHPGHFMRTIRSVGLAIPMLVGPYANVNCMLSLLDSSIRKEATALPTYARRDGTGADVRFVDCFDVIQSRVTSSHHDNNAGFDANVRQGGQLPFEGAGAISRWRLELPERSRAFDYDSISDVILDLRYTARDGGAALAGEARAEIVRRLVRRADCV